MRNLRVSAGFTLIELMIAVAVLAVALVMVLSMIVSAIRLERQTQELNTAKNAAELQMQFLRGRDYVTLLADIGDPAKGGNGTVMRGGFAVASLRPVTGVGDLLNDGLCGWFEVQKRAGAVNENLVDITVRVQWQGGQGGPQVYELVSMKSDRGQRWNPNP